MREYQKLLSSGHLKPDANQEHCLQQLSHLTDCLPAHSYAVKSFQDQLQQYQVAIIILNPSVNPVFNDTLKGVLQWSAWQDGFKAYVRICEEPTSVQT